MLKWCLDCFDLLARVLRLQVRSQSANPVTIRIFGEASVSPAAYSSTAFDVSTRARTTATVEWSPEPSTTVHELLQTPDISSIVAEIISMSGWASGNSVGIMFEQVSGTGVRWVESYRVNSDFATYAGTDGSTPALEVHGPPPPATQVFGTTGRTDSAEQFVANGAMYLTSSDLELCHDGLAQVVGIIFPSVTLSAADAYTLAQTRVYFDVDEVSVATALTQDGTAAMTTL